MDTPGQGYSKATLRDLSVNRWRYTFIALAIVAVALTVFMFNSPAPSPSYAMWLLMLPLVYLLFTLWAAAGYAICKRPDGGLPFSNGNLIVSIIILFVPRELLK